MHAVRRRQAHIRHAQGLPVTVRQQERRSQVVAQVVLVVQHLAVGFGGVARVMQRRLIGHTQGVPATGRVDRRARLGQQRRAQARQVQVRVVIKASGRDLGSFVRLLLGRARRRRRAGRGTHGGVFPRRWRSRVFTRKPVAVLGAARKCCFTKI